MTSRPLQPAGIVRGEVSRPPASRPVPRPRSPDRAPPVKRPAAPRAPVSPPSGPAPRPPKPARAPTPPKRVSRPGGQNPTGTRRTPVTPRPTASGVVIPALVPGPSGGGGRQRRQPSPTHHPNSEIWAVIASAEVLGGIGYCGHAIVADGYSELSTDPASGVFNGHALGDLSCGTELIISNPANGKAVTTRLQDKGLGSTGFPAVMGLYPGTVRALGMSGGEFHVHISRPDGGHLQPVHGTRLGSVGQVVTQADLLYANPLKDAHVTPERIDQGVDYAGTGHFSAIAAGRIVAYVKDGWAPYGNYLEYEITQDGPLKGVHIYHAEGIERKSGSPDTFKAGEWLCRLIPGWHSGTESGFAAGNGSHETWANVYGGGWTHTEDSNSDATRAGIAFSRLVQRLGGPGGLIQGAIIGEWPPWAKDGNISSGVSPVAAGITGSAFQTTNLGSAKQGAGTYDWPVQLLAAWNALDKGCKAAADTGQAIRDYVGPIQYVTEKGTHN